MLEYFYSGEIDKKAFEKHSEDLFAIAHKYEVKQLMEVCENYMAANIDTANFSDRCKYAELYCLPKLEKACFNYFSTNRSTFILSKEWNKFKINNKDFAFRLLEENQVFGEKFVKETRRFTEIQKKILVQKFSEQRYLNSIDRDDMAIKTGLTGSQVMSWFQLRRALWKKNTRRINLF
uniref:Homeobox domain-containing protein n=1 Tax=Meloidogyne incognita TaxID=6306 RepID=A0A914KMW1_MELIC